MYNVEKLEKQWIKYRRKRVVLSTAIVLSIATLIVAFTYFKVTSKIVDINTSVAKVAVAKDIAPKVKSILTKDNVQSKLDRLGTQVPSLETNTMEEAKPERGDGIGQIIFQDEKEQVSKTKVKRKKLMIQVTDRESRDIAKDIESRFAFAKDKSDALFLAKYYYDQNEYSEAEKWALEANKIDSSVEESWLIFAKSQARQGKRVESLKVLQAFFKETGSRNAKILIDKIRRGKNF